MNFNEATDPKGPVPFLQEKRILLTAALVLLADQLTKLIVIGTIEPPNRETRFQGEEIIIIEGFLKFLHWQNSGAAWSIMEGKSMILAAISVIALWLLIYFRNEFEIRTPTGKLAMGMLIGGIVGNLIDRVAYEYVVDFIRFYLKQRDGNEIGYPAFNIADMGICVGVGLLFVMAWREQEVECSDGENPKPEPKEK